MDVAATVLPLVGVALGTLGTVTGQYLATRGATRRHTDERAAAARAERKEAIVAFLDHAQAVEQLLARRGRTEPSADTPTVADDRIHALWLSKKILELVCAHETASFAHRYAAVLDHRAVSPEGLADEASVGRQREYRAEFIEAARHELGVDGRRLYP